MLDARTALTANWSLPTDIRFGPGRIQELGSLCEELDIERPLLVTDCKTARLPFTAEIASLLDGHSIRVTTFSGIDSNPTDLGILEGAADYRKNDCDGVIALGGGSGLDAGKAIALMAGQSRPIRDFEDEGDNWKRADIRGIAPCIAIPTTSGTGSEVGRASVIVDTEQREKCIVFHPRMMPRAVICDPQLTIGLPVWLTAATGLDALTHCFEAYCANGYHPMADGIALRGMQLVARWLPRACEHGADLEARSQMMAAASMGAVAFQKGLGAVHALSHAVGAQYDTHHGLTNAVFLPYVMVRNRVAIRDKAAEAAAAIGLHRPSFDALLKWVLELRVRLGVPHDAAALGIREGDLDVLAAKSVKDAALSGNPVSLDEADLKALLRKACDAELGA